MFARVMAALLALASAPVSAAPALYVAADEDTTIYLFGTIHALDRGGWFDGEVRAAFDRSDELVVEAVLPGRDEPLPALRRADAALPSLLASDDRAKMRRAAGSRFDQSRPWVAWTVLQGEAIGRAGFVSELGADAILVRAAHARNIPIRSLETVEDQIAVLESLPVPDQIELLRRALHDPEAGVRTLRVAVERWRAGDTEEAAGAFNAVFSPESHLRLNLARNAAWAGWIQARMASPGTVFVAVGVAHLGGPGSVQDQLSRLGVAVRRQPSINHPPL